MSFVKTDVQLEANEAMRIRPSYGTIRQLAQTPYHPVLRSIKTISKFKCNGMITASISLIIKTTIYWIIFGAREMNHGNQKDLKKIFDSYKPSISRAYLSLFVLLLLMFTGGQGLLSNSVIEANEEIESGNDPGSSIRYCSRNVGVENIFGGYVVLGGTEDPIVDVVVELFNSSGEDNYNGDIEEESFVVTRTDYFGFFRFNDIPAGNYWLRITKNYYNSTDHHIEIIQGEIVTVIIEMRAPGPLPSIFTGKVINVLNGQPVEDATVTIGGESTTTNSTGEYIIKDIPEGSYVASATKFTYTTDTKTNITIRRDYLTTQDFLISSRPGNVEGAVHWAGIDDEYINRTYEIENVTVVMEGTDGFEDLGPFTTKTFEAYSWEPNYRFEDVPPGTYKLWVESFRFRKEPMEVIVEADRTMTKDIIVKSELTSFTLNISAPVVNGSIYVSLVQQGFHYKDIKENHWWATENQWKEVRLNRTTQVTFDDVVAGDYDIYLSTQPLYYENIFSEDKQVSLYDHSLNEMPHQYACYYALKGTCVNANIRGGKDNTFKVNLQPRVMDRNITFLIKKYFTQDHANDYATEFLDAGTLTLLEGTNYNREPIENHGFINHGRELNLEWDVTNETYFPQKPVPIGKDSKVHLIGIPVGRYKYRLQIPGVLDVIDYFDVVNTSMATQTEMAPHVFKPNLHCRVLIEAPEGGHIPPFTVTLNGPQIYEMTIPGPALSRSDHGGGYFDNVIPGDYVLKVDHRHFKTWEKQVTLDGSQYFYNFTAFDGKSVDELEIKEDVLATIDWTLYTWENDHYRLWNNSLKIESEYSYGIVEGSTSGRGNYNLKAIKGHVMVYTATLYYPFWQYRFTLDLQQDSTETYYRGGSQEDLPNSSTDPHETFFNGYVHERIEDHSNSQYTKYWIGALPGAIVSVGGKSFTTGNDGFYSFYAHWESGDQLKVEKEGYVSYFLDFGFYNDYGIFLDSSPSNLTFIIKEEDKTDPLKDVEMTIVSINSDVMISDGNGMVNLKWLGAGSYSFIFHKNGYVSEVVNVTLVGGETKAVNVFLKELPPPVLGSVVPEYGGDVFVGGLDLEQTFRVFLEPGHPENPVAYVKFQFGNEMKTIYKETNGVWECPFNIRSFKIYPEVHTLEIKAVAKYGQHVNYTYPIEYKIIPIPSWIAAVKNFADEASHDLDAKFIKTHLYSDINISKDDAGYCKYKFSIGYEFALEVDLQKIITNSLGFTRTDDLSNGLGFKVNFFVEFTSNRNVKGGGGAEFELSFPLGEAELAPKSKPKAKLSTEFSASAKGNLGVEVQAEFVLVESGDCIIVNEVKLEGGYEQGVGISVALKDLIEWIGKILTTKTLGMSYVASKILSTLADWLIDVAVEIGITSSLSINAIIEASSDSQLVPEVPFSWKDGDATSTFGLKSELKTTLGKGYVGSISLGMEIKIGTTLGFPEPLLRAVSIFVKAGVSGWIGWWEIPENANVQRTWLVYSSKDSMGTRSYDVIPVRSEFSMEPLLDTRSVTESQRSWLTRENFVWSTYDNSSKILENTSPFCSPSMSIDHNGKQHLLMVRDTGGEELPTSLGIASYKSDQGWSEGPWLSDEGYCSYSPAIASDPDGNALAVWCAYQDRNITASSSPFLHGNEVELRSARYDGISKTWSEPVWETSNEVQELGPKLVYDPSGRFVLLWHEDRDMNPMTTDDSLIHAAVYISQSVGWQRIVDPIPDTSPSDYSVAALNGRIALSYNEGDNVYATIFSDGSWSDPIKLGNNTTGLSSADLLSNGDGVFTWIEIDVGNHDAVRYAVIKSEESAISIYETGEVSRASQIRTLEISKDVFDKPVITWICQEEEEASIFASSLSSSIWSTPVQLLVTDVTITDAALAFDSANEDIYYVLFGSSNTGDDGLFDLWAGKIDYSSPTATESTGGDISISEIKMTPGDPVEGDEIVISATIDVQGISVDDPIQASLIIDGKMAQTMSVNINEKDSNLEVSFIWYGTKGSHILEIEVDSLSQIEEDNEDNNIVSKSISIDEYTGLTGSLDTPVQPTGDNGNDNETGEYTVLLIILIAAVLIIIIIVSIIIAMKRREEVDEEIYDREINEVVAEEDTEEIDIDKLDRRELKAYIKEHDLDIRIMKKHSDDDLRNMICEAQECRNGLGINKDEVEEVEQSEQDEDTGEMDEGLDPDDNAEQLDEDKEKEAPENEIDPNDNEVDEPEASSSEFDLDEFDRKQLKRFIRENELDIRVTKKLSDEDIRDRIRGLRDPKK